MGRKERRGEEESEEGREEKEGREGGKERPGQERIGRRRLE